MELERYITRFDWVGRTLTALFLVICLSQNLHAQALTTKQAAILSSKLSEEKRDTARFTILNELAWYQVLKPGENKADLDSARNYLLQEDAYLMQNHSNLNLGFYHLVYADYYNESGQKKLADAELGKALTYLKRGNNHFLLGSAYFEKMNRAQLSPELVPYKLYWLRLATDEFRKTTDKRKFGDCMKLMADLRIYLKDDPLALPELDSAKKLYQEANSGDWRGLYMLYSEYYHRQANNEKQLEYVLKALHITNANDNSNEAITLKLFASLVYRRLKEYKLSLDYSQAALNEAVKIKNNGSDIYAIAFVSVSNYDKLGSPGLGLNLLNKLEKKVPDNPNNPDINLQLAKLVNYTDLKVYNKAQVYANILVDWAKRKPDFNEVNLIISTLKQLIFTLIRGNFKRRTNL